MASINFKIPSFGGGDLGPRNVGLRNRALRRDSSSSIGTLPLTENQKLSAQKAAKVFAALLAILAVVGATVAICAAFPSVLVMSSSLTLGIAATIALSLFLKKVVNSKSYAPSQDAVGGRGSKLIPQNDVNDVVVKKVVRKDSASSTDSSSRRSGGAGGSSSVGGSGQVSAEVLVHPVPGDAPDLPDISGRTDKDTSVGDSLVQGQEREELSEGDRALLARLGKEVQSVKDLAVLLKGILSDSPETTIEDVVAQNERESASERLDVEEEVTWRQESTTSSGVGASELGEGSDDSWVMEERVLLDELDDTGGRTSSSGRSEREGQTSSRRVLGEHGTEQVGVDYSAGDANLDFLGGASGGRVRGDSSAGSIDSEGKESWRTALSIAPQDPFLSMTSLAFPGTTSGGEKPVKVGKSEAEMVEPLLKSPGMGYFYQMFSDKGVSKGGKPSLKKEKEISSKVGEGIEAYLDLINKLKNQEEVASLSQVAYLYTGLGSSSSLSTLLKSLAYLLSPGVGAEWLRLFLQSNPREEANSLGQLLTGLKAGIVSSASLSKSYEKTQLTLMMLNLFLSGWLLGNDKKINGKTMSLLEDSLRMPRELIIENYIMTGNYVGMLADGNPWFANHVTSFLKIDDKNFPVSKGALISNNLDVLKRRISSKKSSSEEGLQDKIEKAFLDLEASLPGSALGVIVSIGHIRSIIQSVNAFAEFIRREKPSIMDLFQCLCSHQALQAKIRLFTPGILMKALIPLLSSLSIGIGRHGLLPQSIGNVSAEVMGVQGDEKVREALLSGSFFKKVLPKLIS